MSRRPRRTELGQRSTDGDGVGSGSAYDAAGMMSVADVVEGIEIETVIDRLLADPEATYLYVHNAKRGCYSDRVERARKGCLLHENRSARSVVRGFGARLYRMVAGGCLHCAAGGVGVYVGRAWACGPLAPCGRCGSNFVLCDHR